MNMYLTKYKDGCDGVPVMSRGFSSGCGLCVLRGRRADALALTFHGGR